jgi:hypothetical protein
MTRADFYFSKVLPMIQAGGREKCLAPLLMQKEGGMQSKLEPRLRPYFRSSQDYARFIDPTSYGAPFNEQPFPSAAETSRLNEIMIAGRAYPNA